MSPVDKTLEIAIQQEIPSFSLNISWNHDTNKKVVNLPCKWQQFTKPMIQKQCNGFAFITGISFWVLDFDNCWETIPETIRDLLMNTCQSIVKTKRGFHFYFKLCDVSKSFNSASHIFFNKRKYDSIDIRGKGGCIIAPPSHYSDGKDTYIYEWIKGNINTIVEASDTILELLEKEEEKSIHKTIQESTSLDDNEWQEIIELVSMFSKERATNYSEWISVIWALHNTEYSQRSLELAHEFSKTSNNFRHYKFHEVNEIYHKGKEGYTKASLYYWAMKDSPDKYNERFGVDKLEQYAVRGDFGLAELYALENKEKVVCTNQGSNLEFYFLDETINIWKEGTGNDIKRHFSLIMENILLRLLNYYNQQITKSNGTKEAEIWTIKRCELMKILHKTHNNSCTKNVLPYISSALYNPNFVSQLNKIPHLLSVKNGVIDLKSGNLLDRQPHHYFSYSLDIEYNTNSKFNDWNIYFQQVFQNDEEIINWLQYYLGYTLTGETSLQKFVILWGSGSNSKSVLLGFLRKLLGKRLFHTFSIDDLKDNDGGNRDSLYQAKDSRMAVVNETSISAKFDEELLKSMSGQDSITVSAKYKNAITYDPQFKFFIITNNKPQFDPEKEAIWRRVILVPFETKFKDKDSDDWNDILAKEGKMVNRDDNFLKELENNMEGLLYWLVQGSMRFYNEKETIPKRLQEVAKQYKQSCNTYLNWLQENYERTTIESFIRSEELLEFWKLENPKSKEKDRAIQMKVADAMKVWGFEKERKMINSIKSYGYNFLKRRENEDCLTAQPNPSFLESFS